MFARLAIVLVALSLAAPAAALAQSSPFNSLPPAQQQTTTTPAVTVNNANSQDTSGSISGLGKAAIIGFGALLLGGVAWLILRDAKTAAPVEEASERGPKGTVSPQRHARARAKAKAAKQQRRRNRARR